MPAEMCPELAANVLGLDEDDEKVEEKARDALKELLNVSCGNILTELAGTEPVFDLSVPIVSDIGLDVWEDLKNNEDFVSLIVDDYPALLGYKAKQ